MGVVVERAVEVLTSRDAWLERCLVKEVKCEIGLFEQLIPDITWEGWSHAF